MDITLLAKYGVELSNVSDSKTLLTLVKVYNDLNSTLASEKENAKTDDENGNPVKDEYVKSVMENEGLRDFAKSVEGTIRNLIVDAVDRNPEIALHLAKMVDQLSKDLTGEKNYQIAQALKDVEQTAPTIDLPEDWEIRRTETEQVGELIRTIWDLFQAVHQSDEKFVKQFPLKDKIEKGKVVGKIPALNKVTRKVSDEDSAPVGKAAAISRIRYNWNGEDLPAGTMLNVLLHDYVSDLRSGHVVTWSQFKETVEQQTKKGYMQAAKDGATVVFATGTLVLSVEQ